MERRFGNWLVSFSLTRGPRGRIAEKLEQAGHRETRFAYEYDDKGRLVRVTRDGRPAEEYAYDAQGRRVRDWTSERGQRRLAYDSAGRLRRAGDVAYYYGRDNTLAARYQGKRRSLHLDYGGNLGLRSVCATHGRAVSYRTTREGLPLEKHADNGACETFRWLDPLRLAEYCALDRGYRLLFHYRADNRLPHAATFQDGEGSRDWVLGYDQAGSLKAVGDSAGNPVKTIDYDSFGNVVSEEWPWLFLPLGFAGGLRDRDTGFVRFGHRDYDPEVGRFNAQDPAGDTGGDHDPYEYCVDDPINAVDPWGLAEIPLPWRWGTSAHEQARKHADEYGFDVSQCTDDQLDRIFEAIPQGEANSFRKSRESLPQAGKVFTQEEREKMWKATDEQKAYLESWRSRFDKDGCIKTNKK